MTPLAAFKSLLMIIDGTRNRESAAHMEFLEFYGRVVESASSESAREFGKIKVPTLHKGQTRDYLLELNMTDVVWWTNVITTGGRFVKDPSEVQRDMWDRLASLVRQSHMTEKDQAAFNAVAHMVIQDQIKRITG